MLERCMQHAHAQAIAAVKRATAEMDTHAGNVVHEGLRLQGHLLQGLVPPLQLAVRIDGAGWVLHGKLVGQSYARLAACRTPWQVISRGACCTCRSLRRSVLQGPSNPLIRASALSLKP